MSLEAETGVLTQMPIFEGIDPSKLKLIAFGGRRIDCLAGEELFAQGSAPDSVYVILDGEVDVVREDGGKRTTLARLGRGQLIGEIGVLCDQPRNATIVAAIDTTVLRIEGDVFLDFVAGLPQLSMAIIKELSRRLDATNRQVSKPAVAASSAD